MFPWRVTKDRFDCIFYCLSMTTRTILFIQQFYLLCHILCTQYTKNANYSYYYTNHQACKKRWNIPTQLPMQSVPISSCEFKSRSWRSALDTTLCVKVFSDLSHTQFTIHLSHKPYTPHHYHKPLTFTLHTIPIHYLRGDDRMVILKLDLKLSKQSATITAIFFNSIIFMARCTWYNIIWKTLSVTCDMSVIYFWILGFLH